MTVLRVVENRTVMRVTQRDVANTIRVTSRENKIVFRTTQRGLVGPQGDTGDVGIGIPTGGTTGQILAKNSNTNYDTEWIDEQDLSGYATTSELTAGLAGKANTVHTHTASQITDFNTAVAANSAVAANTAKISFDSASSSKLAGIEAGADVTDATNVAAAGAIMSSQKGAANGVAELDSGGLVPSSQLPSYVDDVIEVANFASLPGTGATGKIYVTLDTNITYRWSGSAYVEISQSIALGETSSTAYRGDRGKTAYDHSQLITGNPHNVTKADVGLANVDNTSDANKPISTATQIAFDELEKLTIAMAAAL